MTLPVKVCRTASATVIRGPASSGGRETTLLSVLKVRAREKEVAQIQKQIQEI